MGNSNSSHTNQTHSHQPYHPAYQREIRGPRTFQHDPPTHNAVYNPEYKVLPERVPGQKLRLTDNGAILQGGGTISGKPIMLPAPPDPEFLRLLRNRQPDPQDRDIYMPNLNNARYYSNPDLARQTSPYDSHGYETDVSSSNKRYHKKSRAPPPPTSNKGHESDGQVSRASSFCDPVTGTIVKIQPWQQRQETKCVGVPSRMTGSMERIIEHREIARHQGHHMYKPNMVVDATDGHWTGNRHQRLDSSSSQENRFHKHSKLSQSELLLNSRHSDRSRYAGSIDRHQQDRDKCFRAKSIDSLQAALHSERQMSEKLRKSLENLNNVISIAEDQRTRVSSPPSDRQHRVRGSQESMFDRRKYAEEEIRRPSSRQENITSRQTYSTGSLQRCSSSGKFSNDPSPTPQDLKMLIRERSSSSSTGRMGSPVTKTEIMLQRKDSFPTPKQYYFGEGMGSRNGNVQSPVPLDSQKDLNPDPRWIHQHSFSSSGGISQQIHKSDVKSGATGTGSRQSEGTHSPFGHHQEMVAKKTPILLQRPDGGHERPRDVTSGDIPPAEGHFLHSDSILRQKSQGRQRNSYAFEDRRYRYELETPKRSPIASTPLKVAIENSDEEEMDISMKLRPTLPKRTPALPRFSPTQAWRSLNLDSITNAQNVDNSGEADVLEDCIHRVTRPIAPPRANNERGADSGISQDAGSPGFVNEFDLGMPQEKRSDHNKSISPPPPPPPHPHQHQHPHQHPILDPEDPLIETPVLPIQHKRSMWTPEEDLASDFDGGSTEHPTTGGHGATPPQMISVQPKLTSIKSMFSSKVSPMSTEERSCRGGKKLWMKANDANTPHTFNSMRKLKRSISGVLGDPNSKDGLQMDENWSFSRSLPNSLRSGDGREKSVDKKNDENNEGNDEGCSEVLTSFQMRRVESGPIHPTKTFFGLRNRVMSLDSLHPDKTHSMPKMSNQQSLFRYSASEHIIYLPEYDAKRIVSPTNEVSPQNENFENVIYVGYEPKKGKKFTFQSTVRQQERKRLEQKLSQVAEMSEKQREKEKLLVNQVEEEFQKKREREKATICHQLKILTDPSNDAREQRDSGFVGSETPPPPLMTASQLLYFCQEDVSSSNSPLSSQPSDPFAKSPTHHSKLEKQDSGFFSGISKWMRRQQKLEEHQKTFRQEPDGAPAPLNHQQDSSGSDVTKLRLQEIQRKNRFQNGNIEENEAEHTRNIYQKLTDLAEKEDRLRRNGNFVRGHQQDQSLGDLRTPYIFQDDISKSRDHPQSSPQVSPNQLMPSSSSSLDESTSSSSAGRNHKHLSHGDRRPLRPRSSIEDSDRSSDVEDAEPKSSQTRYRSPGTNQRLDLVPPNDQTKYGNGKDNGMKLNGFGESSRTKWRDGDAVTSINIRPYSPTKQYRPVFFQPGATHKTSAHYGKHEQTNNVVEKKISR